MKKLTLKSSLWYSGLISSIVFLAFFSFGKNLLPIQGNNLLIYVFLSASLLLPISKWLAYATHQVEVNNLFEHGPKHLLLAVIVAGGNAIGLYQTYQLIYITTISTIQIFAFASLFSLGFYLTMDWIRGIDLAWN